jgi:hypothetical protein
MADQVFMYAIVAGAFVILTGILFWARASRKSEERKSTSTSATTSGERKGAI